MKENKKTENHHTAHYYNSLTRNMVLIIIFISVTPLLLISGILLYHFQNSYHEKVIDHLEEVVEKHKQNIDSFLNEKLADIRNLAIAYPFEQLMNEAFLQERLSMLSDAHGGVFVDLGLINEQGMQIAYAGPFKLSKAVYSKAEWFKKAMKNDYFISDVFLGLRNLPHFIVAVKHKWNERTYIVRASIDFVAFNSLVENIHIGKTGLAFILNKEGEFQTNPRIGISNNKQFYTDFISKQAIEDKITVLEKINDAEQKCIYVMSPLKNGDWILIYQQDTPDALSDLYTAQKLILLIFLVGGMAIVVTAIFLSKKMVNYIKLADQEKEMMNEQIIEAGKLVSLGELAAGIAHEINNPVAIMIEEASWIEDLLNDETELQENENEFKRALKQIKTQGWRCKEITSKLLSFARKTDTNTRAVEVNDSINEVIELSEQRTKYSNIQMKKNLTSNPNSIHASPAELQQVFLNLINNALDAMGTKGGKLEITSRIDGNFVVVDIADSGEGIPKANLARIFDPFFTTKQVGKGTGLGLSICYGIIKKMGGKISVNSSVGLGTTFHVYLPLPKEENNKNRSSTKNLFINEKEDK